MTVWWGGGGRGRRGRGWGQGQGRGRKEGGEGEGGRGWGGGRRALNMYVCNIVQGNKLSIVLSRKWCRNWSTRSYKMCMAVSAI